MAIHPSSPPGDDFSPVNLQKVSDEIRFDLYDEVVVDLLQVRAEHLMLYNACIYVQLTITSVLLDYTVYVYVG